MEKIKKLNEELNYSKTIIEQLKSKIKELENKQNNIQSNDTNIIQSLKEQINNKDKEIDLLKKNGSSNNPKYVPLDQITCINFISMDQKIHLPIPCIKTDVFAEVEEKLYKEYPEYRETNNYFVVNGNQILRFKTVGENNICHNQTVMLIIPEK